MWSSAMTMRGSVLLALVTVADGSATCWAGNMSRKEQKRFVHWKEIREESGWYPRPVYMSEKGKGKGGKGNFSAGPPYSYPALVERIEHEGGAAAIARNIYWSPGMENDQLGLVIAGNSGRPGGAVGYSRTEVARGKVHGDHGIFAAQL